MLHTTEYSRDPRKQVVYNQADRDWTALYDGRPIGAFRRPQAAWAALDDHAHTLLSRHSATPLSVSDVPTEDYDPRTLFALGGPLPHVGVSDTALAHALQRYCDEYHEPKLQQRAQKAHAAVINRERWTVPSAGTLHINGSKGDTYLVRDVAAGDATMRECVKVKTDGATGATTETPCPDQTYRAHQNNAQCYHVIARELIRLAQVLDSVEPSLNQADAVQPYAYVTIGGRLLGLALSIAYMSEGDATFRIVRQTLEIETGIPCRHALALQCADGNGAAALYVDAHALEQLWVTFRPLATKIESLQLFIDPDTRTVILGTADFSAQAIGIPLSP